MTAALAEDLGVARRHHVDRVHRRRRPAGDRRVRRPRQRACSPAPPLVDRDVSARSTRASTVAWHARRRRRRRSRRRDRRASRARCARSSPASGSRSTSCATAPASRRSRAATCAPTHGRARILDTRKTLPGPARVREGRGARRRRLQPPRVALRRGAHQGQPPRGARHHEGGRAGPRPLAERGSSRSSATRSSRSPRRATRAPTSCCSTT